MAFDIPVSIFAIFWGISIGLVVLSFAMKPRVPVFAVVAGAVLIILIPLIDNVIVDYVEAVDYTLGYPMNVTTGTASVPFSSTVTGIAEKPANTLSVLYNKQISCISIDISKSGNPTGDLTLGILDGNNNVIKTFGTVIPADISTSQKTHTRCLPNHDYWTISLYDRIGAKHTTSTGTDFIRVFVTSTNDFDGTNSYRTSYSSGAWADVTTTDVRMITIYDKANIVDEPVKYSLGDSTNANWYVRVYLAFFGVMFILIGVVEQKFGE